MNQKQKKKITHWLAVIVIGIALGLGLQFVRAWTEPTQAPPNGNVGAPINTSANPQTKAGSFTSGGDITANQFCLGGVCISTWPSGTATTIGTGDNKDCTIYGPNPDSGGYNLVNADIPCACYSGCMFLPQTYSSGSSITIADGHFGDGYPYSTCNHQGAYSSRYSCNNGTWILQGDILRGPYE